MKRLALALVAAACLSTPAWAQTYSSQAQAIVQAGLNASPVTLAQGGTGATTQAGAQTNLGLGTSNNVNFNSVYLGSGNATVTNSFTAPLTEVTAFTGSTTSATATLGAFLAQNDGTMGGLGGIIENLNIVSGEVGSRIASASNLNVTSKSANTSGVIYVGGSEYCDIHVSDGSSSGSGSAQNYSACSGSNPQALN